MRGKSKASGVITAFLFLWFLSTPVSAGTIKGKVNVKGLRSPGNILVYITKAPTSSVDLLKSTFVMDQQNLTFLPHVLPVPVGATVNFPNNDKVQHSVFSLSRAKKFNLGYYRPGQSDKATFDNPGLVELKCDMHAEMSAYIPVMKNLYFGLTDATGNFNIPDDTYLEKHGIKATVNLPPGKYIIRTWHEKLKSTKQVVEISNNGEAKVILNLKRGTPGALYKR